MRAPKAFWIGILCAIGGCTQLLELDQEYRPGQTSNGGSGGMATGGSGGTGGGTAGSGGSSECMVDDDCTPAANVCAKNTCINKSCVISNLPAGTSCNDMGMATCDGNGKCGECDQPSDCTMLPPDDECQTRTCDGNLCGQTFAAAGTLLQNQVAGDCVDAVCDGNGKKVPQLADMDLPEDNNPCTKNTCANGMPSNPFEPINTACGAMLKCNDMGQCVGCITANDCAGTDDSCKTRTCVSGMCGFNFTAVGTDLPTGQTASDCKILECDGQGNIITSPDNADLPVDGNPCTKDVCTAGVPSNPLEPNNTPCGNGYICNSMGACKKINASTCAMATECASGNCVDGYCCDTSCAQLCRACNLPGNEGKCTVVPAGYADNTCMSPKSCDGTTGNNACTTKYPMGYPCSTGSQCGSGMCIDGVCCSSTCLGTCQACNITGNLGTCANVPLGQEDPIATTACTGVFSCNGAGACLLDNGQPCMNNGECVSNNCTAMTCQ